MYRDGDKSLLISLALKRNRVIFVLSGQHVAKLQLFISRPGEIHISCACPF